MRPLAPKAARAAALDAATKSSPTTDRPEFEHWEATEDVLFTVTVHDDDTFSLGQLNPAGERRAGLSNAEVAGKRAEEILSDDDAALVTARYRQCLTAGKPITYLETLDFPTGRSDWRTTLEPIRDESGRIVRLLGRAWRLESVEATPEDLTEGEFRKALDIFPLGIALLDERGVVLYVNAPWRSYGARHGVDDGIGVDYVTLCDLPTSAGLPDGAAVAEKLSQLLNGEKDQFGHPYRWKHRHFMLRASRVMINRRLRVTMAHQDVTEEVLAREQAARSMELLLAAQEEERVRVALEVHDLTAQHLVALNLGLANLRESNAPPHILADMRQSVAAAQREVRTLEYLLYPPKLSGKGLTATLRAFTDGFRRRSGLPVTAVLDGDLEALPLEVKQVVLRVVQEALANVHRHADASAVRVRVGLTAAGLRVTVLDNGRTGRGGSERIVGIGLRGQEARLAQIGGSLEVTHRATGTVVDVHVPSARLGPITA